ncbi:symporter [Legionella israelensis]|uniref:Symporter n=1 Tax=Legionella israelensis TaxID=454 RepID=A0AAX1EG91_9GAMM|nr:symporter [Legionella israelensis]QBR84126.1 symporter [Legionella israelensis]
MSKQDKAAILFSRIEQYISFKSNPELMNRILSDLNLDSLYTNNKEFNDFLVKAKTEAIDLNPLLSHIKLAILANEPLCSLLAYIQDNNLISDEEIKKASRTLQLQINMLCLFEAIMLTMTNGESFAKEVYDHLIRRSGSYLPGNPLFDFFFGTPLHASLFERLKLISIKPGMLSILFHKSTGDKTETKMDLDSFIEKMHLVGWNRDIDLATEGVASTVTVPAMGVNILEAAWQDLTSSRKDNGGLNNAKAGIGLISIMEEKQYPSHFELRSEILPEGVQSNEKANYELLPDLKVCKVVKKLSQFDVDSQWRDLYSSWNLFFVLSNIDNVFMPIKLLIPTVFSAEPQNYKEVRVMSLFLLGNIFLAENTKNNPFFSSDYNFRHATEIFSQWGKINKNYAEEILHKLCPDSPKEVESVFSHIFGHYPNLNFTRHLLGFGQRPREYNLTQNYQKPRNALFFSSTSTIDSERDECLVENTL